MIEEILKNHKKALKKISNYFTKLCMAIKCPNNEANVSKLYKKYFKSYQNELEYRTLIKNEAKKLSVDELRALIKESDMRLSKSELLDMLEYNINSWKETFHITQF